MKVIITILLSVYLASCEVPPYPPRGFRPSPPFNLPVRQPQTVYGVPDAVPSKLSQPSPQIQYGVPNQQGPSSDPNLTPNFSSKQTVPSTSYAAPLTNNPYRTIISESQLANRVTNQGPARPSNLTPNFIAKQTIPSTSYGVPVTSSPYRTIISEPQVAYGAPSRQSRPSSQYEVPDTRNVENLEQIRQLNLLLQLSQSSKSNQQNQADVSLSQSQNFNRNVGIPNQNYLPTKEASNFRGNLQPQNPQQNIGQPAQEYLPAREQNFRNGFNLPQSNAQEQFDGRIPNVNVQKLSQQYLPVKEASNFEKGRDFPQPIVPLNNPQLFNTAGNAQNGGDEFNQQQLANINPNIALASQNRKPITSYDAPFPQPTAPLNNQQLFNTAGNAQNGGADFNQQQLANINPNIALAPQNRKPITSYDAPFPQPTAPLNNQQLFNTAGNAQNGGADFNQQQLANINPNIALAPQNRKPITSYDAPLQSNLEIQQLNVRRLQNSNKVQTPIRQNAPQPVQPVQQNREFGDSNVQGVGREQINDRYLPPSSTASPIQRPINIPASLPKDNPDEEEQPTESKDDVGGPNIAVATAVSGIPGEQSFYLLQPDGRLQRVVYQKTRTEGDRENEYTANYLFQNIQADPNLVYSPLIGLGKR